MFATFHPAWKWGRVRHSRDPGLLCGWRLGQHPQLPGICFRYASCALQQNQSVSRAGAAGRALTIQWSLIAWRNCSVYWYSQQTSPEPQVQLYLGIDDHVRSLSENLWGWKLEVPRELPKGIWTNLSSSLFVFNTFREKRAGCGERAPVLTGTLCPFRVLGVKRGVPGSRPHSAPNWPCALGEAPHLREPQCPGIWEERVEKVTAKVCYILWLTSPHGLCLWRVLLWRVTEWPFLFF